MWNIWIYFLTHFKTQTVSQTRKCDVTFIFPFLPIVIERLKQNFNKHKLESVSKHFVFLDFFFLTKIPQLPIKIVKTSKNTKFCFYSKDQTERKAWKKISCSMYYVKVKKHQTLTKYYLNERGKILFEWKRQNVISMKEANIKCFWFLEPATFLFMLFKNKSVKSPKLLNVP